MNIDVLMKKLRTNIHLPVLVTIVIAGACALLTIAIRYIIIKSAYYLGYDLVNYSDTIGHCLISLITSGIVTSFIIWKNTKKNKGERT
jgi:hypothetical protein